MISIDLTDGSREYILDDPIKQGETEKISFTINRSTVLAGATFRFAAKQYKSDTSPVINSVGVQGGEEGQWDFTSIASRIAAVTLRPVETQITPGIYYGELTVKHVSGEVLKSNDLVFRITESVMPYTTTTTTTTTTT